MSGLTTGMRGFVCSPNSYIYFNLGFYDAIVITCRGYRDGGIVDDTFLIATAANFINSIVNGTNSVSLYKKDNSFCVYIPRNTTIFITYSFKAMVTVRDVLNEGYTFYSF